MDIGENFGEFRIEWYQVEVDRTNSKGTVAILKFKKSPVSFQVPSHFWAGDYSGPDLELLTKEIEQELAKVLEWLGG